MASRMALIGYLMVVAAVLLVGGATANTYTVGDNLMWTVPPLGKVAYSTWAKTKDFDINDIIVFNWTGTHDVAEVSQADFDNCTKTNAIGTIQTTSPVNFTLNTNATRYFICTVDSHCSLGQKVEISLDNSLFNSGASLTISALSVLLMAIVISFLSHSI